MFSAEFCERVCAVGTRARAGHRFARLLHAREMRLTFGGCPWGRARQRKYGVRPEQPIPAGRKDACPQRPACMRATRLSSAPHRCVGRGGPSGNLPDVGHFFLLGAEPASFFGVVLGLL
jgi:hypothetical protein